MVLLAFCGCVVAAAAWMCCLAAGWLDLFTGTVLLLLIIALAIQTQHIAEAAEAETL